MLDTTIPGLQIHFANLYGRSNSIAITGGLDQRIALLHLAIGTLADNQRKKRYENDYLSARIFSWTMAIANHFPVTFPLGKGMAYKFPRTCGYCHHIPCECGPNRPPHQVDKVDDTQVTWTLREWQTHLNALYGDHNRRRGIGSTLIHLSSEVSEVGILAQMGMHGISDITTVELEYSREIADITSLVIAIANVLDVDLEEAVMRHYGKGCPRCGKMPCDCPTFEVRAGILCKPVTEV